jgi:hypothetical protein
VVGDALGGVFVAALAELVIGSSAELIGPSVAGVTGGLDLEKSAQCPAAGGVVVGVGAPVSGVAGDFGGKRSAMLLSPITMELDGVGVGMGAGSVGAFVGTLVDGLRVPTSPRFGVGEG